MRDVLRDLPFVPATGTQFFIVAGEEVGAVVNEQRIRHPERGYLVHEVNFISEVPMLLAFLPNKPVEVAVEERNTKLLDRKTKHTVWEGIAECLLKAIGTLAYQNNLFLLSYRFVLLGGERITDAERGIRLLPD